MTAKQRARRRRREDDGPRAGAGDRAATDRDQRSPRPELLQLQALGGNAAVQRLVTESAQLQREDLEEEEQRAVTETQPAEAVTETDGAGASSEGPVGAGAVMASMWKAGVLVPLASAVRLIESGGDEDLMNALHEINGAEEFLLETRASIIKSFPDASDAWSAVFAGLQSAKSDLQPLVGVAGPSSEMIGEYLGWVAGAAMDFSEVFEG